MESDEIRAQLRDVERAAAAPYVDHPPSPRWLPVAFGAWVAAFVLCFLLDGPLFAAVVVALLLLELGFIRWVAKRHGALPDPTKGEPPAEIVRQYRNYLVGLAAIAVAVVLLAWLVDLVLTAVVAFVLVTGAYAVYERTYDRAAAQVRARLS